MNVSFNNLGFIKRGSVKTNDITIIFGPNNVGKTYISYSIYAILLEYKKKFSSIGIAPESLVDSLIDNGSFECDVFNLFKIPDSHELCELLSKDMPKFFKDVSGVLARAKVSVDNNLDVYASLEIYFRWVLKVSDKISLRVTKEKRDQKVKFEVLKMSSPDEKIEDDEGVIDRVEMKSNVEFLINHIGVENVFCNVLKTPFIITSERTGISLFLKEIDKNRNDLVNEIAYESISNTKQNRNHIRNILKNRVSKFAEPINNNINLIRDSLNDYSFDDTSYVEDKMYIFEALNDLVGGEYSVKNDDIMFTPKNDESGVKIPISLVSGAGKSLFLLDLYVRKYIDKDSYLIIDEPELNLHPSNQIKMAKLLVRLANYGVKIIITTHSDYLVKELNNRVMAYELQSNKLNDDIGYHNYDLISKDRIDAFTISESGVVHGVDKSIYGVSSSLFDSAITDVDVRAEKLITQLFEEGHD